MRIVHVAPSIARRDGGPSEVLRGLLPAQLALGHDVGLIVTDKGMVEGDLEGVEGISTVVRARWPRSWSFAPGIGRAIRRAVADADIVHIHSIHTYTSTVAMLVCRRLGVPFVLEPHGALDDYHFSQSRHQKHFYTRVVDGWGMRGLYAMITSSELEATDAAPFGTVALPLVPLGVAPELFELRRRPTDEVQVLFLGRLVSKKRVDLLLRALAEPPLLGARAVIAGPAGADLTYDPLVLAQRLGVADRVTFMGQVDRRQRSELLSRARAFVLASDDESFGVSVAEAMAAGCPPIVSSRVGLAAAAEVAEALVVVEQEPQAIAAAVARVLGDPLAAAKLGQRARAYARREFTWFTAASRAVQAYNYALAVH